MLLAISKDELCKLLIKQLDSLFGVVEDDEKYICTALDTVLERSEKCFSSSSNKYNYKEKNGIKQTYFNPFQSAQYTIYLYFFSNTLSTQASLLADKIYYLNKALNGCDLYHQIQLPAIFWVGHPVGSVMGRAQYNDFFFFAQNCTVGNNKGIYPVIGKNVKMCASSSIIGNCKIGDNVIIGAGCTVKDQNIPDNTVVFGVSPNLILKERI